MIDAEGYASFAIVLKVGLVGVLLWNSGAFACPGLTKNFQIPWTSQSHVLHFMERVFQITEIPGIEAFVVTGSHSFLEARNALAEDPRFSEARYFLTHAGVPFRRVGINFDDRHFVVVDGRHLAYQFAMARRPDGEVVLMGYSAWLD